MANKIVVKRSAVAAKVPLTTDLDLGEIAVNTFDGKMYIKKDDGAEAIVEVGANATTDWGDIAGTLSNQTDLQTELDGKLSLDGSSNAMTGDIVRTILSKDIYKDPTYVDAGAIGITDYYTGDADEFVFAADDFEMSGTPAHGVRVKGGYIALDSETIGISVPGAENGSRLVASGVTPNGNTILGWEPPPVPDYTVSQTNTADVDIGSGAPVTSWVEIVPAMTVGQDIAIGEGAFYYYALTQNKTTNRGGTVEVAVGINGALPVSGGVSTYIPPDATITVTGTGINSSAFTNGDVVRTYMRIISSDNNAFGVDVLGATTSTKLTLKVAGSGGGGDVTSVFGRTGIVAALSTDYDSFYASIAQGTLADSATQPGDNNSTLTNDSAYITLGDIPADAVTSVFGRNGIVVADSADYASFYADITSETPAGGTAGQVLTKIDGTDYNTEWAAGGGGASTNWIDANDSTDFTTGPSAVGFNSVAFGDRAVTDHAYGVAIGNNVQSSTGGLVIGGIPGDYAGTPGTTSASGNTIVIGYTAYNFTSTSVSSAVAIGQEVKFSSKSVTVGYQAEGEGYQSVAVGQLATTTGAATSAVAIGSSMVASNANEVKIGNATNFISVIDGQLTIAGSADTMFKIPKYTTALRPAATVAGSLIYDSDLDALVTYDGAAWNAVGGGTVSLTNIGGVTETIGATVAINCSTTNVYRGAGGTFAFSSIPVGMYTCSIYITDAVGTFPVGTLWQDGTAPTLTSDTDIVIMSTPDQGTTWYGSYSLGYA